MKTETKKAEASKIKTNKPRKQAVQALSATQKCEAVLSLWTESRKPAELYRELGVSWVHLHHWQERALEAMLAALEPRQTLERGPILNKRLGKLLEKKLLQRQKRVMKSGLLTKRLQNIPTQPIKEVQTTQS